MPATLQTVSPSSQKAPALIWQARQRIIRQGPFAGHEGDIRIALEEDCLVLRGRLPSFYLKQVLQTLLADLPGVARIENRVAVVCCNGLSSEPPRREKNGLSRRT